MRTSYLRICFSFAVLILIGTVKAYAGVKVVIDWSAINAVNANSIKIETIEQEHNRMIDSINEKEQKIAKYTATMESIKELYRMSMQNVKGFGYESTYYIAFGKELALIPVNATKAMKAISKSPLANYVNSVQEILNVYLDAADAVKMFTDVVNNGKVDMSEFTSGKGDKFSELLKNAHVGKGDGYNFLDRYTRMALASTLIGKLRDLNIHLEMIVWSCEQAKNFMGLCYSIDPDTWLNILTSRSIANELINDWNNGLRG